MRFHLLAAALAVAAGVNAFTPPHPCEHYRTKVPKLQSCATAKAFCSSFLKGSGSFTRTSTATTTFTFPTSTEVVTVNNPDTLTSYTSTVTVAAQTSTVTVPTTTTTTYSSALTCAVSTIIGQRGVANPSNVGPSCGIAKTANPSLVSGACNCILARSTTVTTTVFSSPPDATTTSTLDPSTIMTDSTTTTTPVMTTYLATATTTVCTAAPTFVLQVINPGGIQDGQYIALNDDGQDPYGTLELQMNGFAASSSDASRFVIDPDNHQIITNTSSGVLIGDVDDLTESTFPGIYFNVEYFIQNYPTLDAALSCYVAIATLVCSQGDRNIFYIDPDYGVELLTLQTGQTPISLAVTYV